MLVEQLQDVVDDCILGLRQQVRLRKSGLRNTSAGIIAFYNCKRPMKCGAISQKGGGAGSRRFRVRLMGLLFFDTSRG